MILKQSECQKWINVDEILELANTQKPGQSGISQGVHKSDEGSETNAQTLELPFS